jgi:hypothetical protein
MKTQVVRWIPTTLGPFLRLILTLTAQPEAENIQHLQSHAGEAPEVSADAVIDRQKVPEATHLVFTHATTVGPFLTLLLTLHNRRSWIERDWWQSPTLPRGAILAARYISR